MSTDPGLRVGYINLNPARGRLYIDSRRYRSQYSHLITRRLRELNVFAEMLPCTQRLADLPYKPKGVILSGSPYSVYATDAPHVDPAVFGLEVSPCLLTTEFRGAELMNTQGSSIGCLLRPPRDCVELWERCRGRR